MFLLYYHAGLRAAKAVKIDGLTTDDGPKSGGHAQAAVAGVSAVRVTENL
jgi:hypothetical protein